jgi:hypothetical protein
VKGIIIMKKFVLMLIASMNLLICRAQSDSELLKQLTAEDTNALHALALYPENIRTVIYEACVYPELLVRLGTIQKNTASSFQNIVSGLSREQQEEIWDLTRYPGLIGKLAEGGRKSEKEIKSILVSYPEEIHETARSYGRNEYPLLVRINDLDKESEKYFEDAIKEYPEPTKKAYRELVNYPEVISILNENLKLTILVGNIYKRNPKLVKQHMDALSLEVARNNAKEFENYKNGLEKNPEAKKEMESAAKNYAIEQGYEEDELVIRNETVIVNYVTYPYPYWYGYPTWYAHSYWYPYPYWYDWGFYFTPNGIVYIGMPSWWYMQWYYFYYPNYYYYPYYTDYCVSHYYGHRNSTTSLTRSTRKWVNTNEASLPDNYFSEPLGRPERIRQLGKFEKEFTDFKSANPQSTITRDEFLVNKREMYPNLQVPANKKREEVRPEKVQPQTDPRPETPQKTLPETPQQRPQQQPQHQPQQRPPVKFPTDRQRTPPQPRTNPQPQPRPQQQPRQKTPPKREANIPLRDNYPQMNEAQNYHWSSWMN